MEVYYFPIANATSSWSELHVSTHFLATRTGPWVMLLAAFVISMAIMLLIRPLFERWGLQYQLNDMKGEASLPQDSP